MSARIWTTCNMLSTFSNVMGIAPLFARRFRVSAYSIAPFSDGTTNNERAGIGRIFP